MKGRVWLVGGAAAGIALAAGAAPYVAGAARSIADTAQHVVGTGGAKLIAGAARHGAPQRTVTAATALLAVLLPGITALLLVIAARGTLRLRAIVGLAVVALGAGTFAYQSGGVASGALVLAMAVAAVAVVATGPLVAAPLTALAGLIGGEFLPRLLQRNSTLPNAPVAALHQALFNSPGSPLALRVVVLLFAAAPFAVAAKLVLTG